MGKTPYYEINVAAIAVGRAPSSARKVLRLAQASDDLPGQFPSMVRGRLPTSMSAGSSPAFALPWTF